MSKGLNVGECPWIGPEPCEESDAKRFFGRNLEVQDLFSKVNRQTLTILTAESGAGKTSLVRAGLIPELRLERERNPTGMGFAICARDWGKAATRSGPSQPGNHPARVMMKAIEDAIDGLQDAVMGKKDLLGINQLRNDLDDLKQAKRVVGNLAMPDMEIENLCSYLERLRKAVQGERLVIVVDQAEEFMGSGVTWNPRDHLSAIHEVLASIVLMKDIRLVVSLRVEYMGKLRPLEDRFSPMAQRVFYLKPLTWANAREAILQSAVEESDAEIDAQSVERILEYACEPLDNDHYPHDLLPIDMLIVQAFLKDFYEFGRKDHSAKRDSMNPSRRLKLDLGYLEKYIDDIRREQQLSESGARLAEVPMLRWIDAAFTEKDAERVDLIRRVAANMGTVLSTPRGFKSHTTSASLVFHSMQGNLPLDVVRQTDMNKVQDVLAYGAGLTEEDFHRLVVKVSKAGYDAVDCLVDKNILKDYGTDEQGSRIYSLQHDGYTPALTVWCSDPYRRENDSLVPEVGVYGRQIRRVTTIENITLNEVNWEGCIVLGVQSKNVTFQNCKFNGTFFNDCMFEGCTFQQCTFNGTVFEGGEFRNVTFLACIALGMVARKMNWQDIVFRKGDFSSAVINEITLGHSLQLENVTAQYAQIYGFKEETPGEVLDITAHGCDLHGTLFKDYTQDRNRFNCDNVSKYITIGPGENKK